MFIYVVHRPGVVKAVEDFKLSVYGDNYDEESDGKASEASKKRKAAAENASKESANYNWADLADNGQVYSCFNSHGGCLKKGNKKKNIVVLVFVQLVCAFWFILN